MCDPSPPVASRASCLGHERKSPETREHESYHYSQQVNRDDLGRGGQTAWGMRAKKKKKKEKSAHSSNTEKVICHKKLHITSLRSLYYGQLFSCVSILPTPESINSIDEGVCGRFVSFWITGKNNVKHIFKHQYCIIILDT